MIIHSYRIVIHIEIKKYLIISLGAPPRYCKGAGEGGLEIYVIIFCSEKRLILNDEPSKPLLPGLDPFIFFLIFKFKFKFKFIDFEKIKFKFKFKFIDFKKTKFKFIDFEKSKFKFKFKFIDFVIVEFRFKFKFINNL